MQSAGNNVFKQFGFEGDDEEEDSDGPQNGWQFEATTITGMKRNRCSRTAAANIQFQGICAEGAKLAGWGLLYNGYGDRLVNFIHDEYVYWLYPEELKVQIPVIEKIMIESMAKIIPDVKVGVETSCGLHWDKKAVEFEKLEWTPEGLPILEEPHFVQEVYAGTVS